MDKKSAFGGVARVYSGEQALDAFNNQVFGGGSWRSWNLGFRGPFSLWYRATWFG
jgi:hypothetical protein